MKRVAAEQHIGGGEEEEVLHSNVRNDVQKAASEPTDVVCEETEGKKCLPTTYTSGARSRQKETKDEYRQTEPVRLLCPTEEAVGRPSVKK